MVEVYLGYKAHADVNAAINIHHRWTESLNQQDCMSAGHAGDARGGNTSSWGREA